MSKIHSILPIPSLLLEIHSVQLFSSSSPQFLWITTNYSFSRFSFFHPLRAQHQNVPTVTVLSSTLDPLCILGPAVSLQGFGRTGLVRESAAPPSLSANSLGRHFHVTDDSNSAVTGEHMQTTPVAFLKASPPVGYEQSVAMLNCWGSHEAVHGT